MTPAFTISDTETLILALLGREWLLVSCQLSVVGKKDILLSPLLPWFRDKTVVAPEPGAIANGITRFYQLGEDYFIPHLRNDISSPHTMFGILEEYLKQEKFEIFLVTPDCFTIRTRAS